MYLVVPYRFELIVAGITFHGIPLITDLIDEPTVRAYRAIS
jgi:hypothetical protein